MAKKAFNAGQLIPTSSTPPSNAGFYRIDKNTIGVVGNMVQKNAQTNAESNVASGANLAAELAALGVSRAPTILDAADIASRPPRLWPQDSTGIKLFCSDGVYAYGNDAAQNVMKRVNVLTMAQSTGWDFGSGFVIEEVFSGHGIILAAVKNTGIGKSNLYRSDNQGITFTLVHNIGTSPDGTTQLQNNTILMRGLDFGTIQGQDAIMFGVYGDGTLGDTIYVAASYDNGNTWNKVNTWNLTATVNARHCHVVRYDNFRQNWLFGFGDADAASALFRWDGVSAWPGDVAHSVLQATPGFTVLHGEQRYRVVDILITEQWLYSYTDTTSARDGGIWRFKPDLTQHHRVNHLVFGKYHEGWSGLQADDGTLLMMDTATAATVSNDQRYIGVYASSDGNRWFEIGRFALTGTGVKIPRGMFKAAGKIWISVTSEAGKGAFSTTSYSLGGKFLEERADNLGPCYYVDFANGNDANDGWSQATAWKTARNMFATSGKITHGARVILSSGTSVENGVDTINYASNASPATDTERHVQISGQGKGVTILTPTGALGGWRDAFSTRTWDIEFCNMTIAQTNASHPVLYDQATISVTPSTWTLRDAAITGGLWTVHIRSTNFVAYRSEITQILDINKRCLMADLTGSIRLYGCVVYGANSYQAGDGQIVAKHCEFQGFVGTGITMLSGCTKSYIVQNCIFSDSGQGPLSNSSATAVTSADVFGNVYNNSPGAGIPNPVLFPISGPVDRDPLTRTPYSWSSLLGKCSPLGVLWDFNGKPFRASPAVGCVEGSP